MNVDSPSDLIDSSAADAIREGLKQDYSNVYATAIGYRRVNDKKTGNPCIFAYVDQKESESELDPEEILPRKVDGVHVDVREVDRDDMEDQQDGSPTRHSRIRPVASGLRVGGAGSEWASIGPMVFDESGNESILVSHHLVENGTFKDILYQPTEDTGEADDNVLASVTQGEGSFDNDWYYAQLDDPSDFTNEILGYGPITEIGQPSLNDRIVTTGARTGLTGGELIAISFDGDRQDYEFNLDEDSETAGNSGNPLAFFDGDQLKLFGTNNSRSGNSIFAADLGQIQSSSGFTFDEDGSYTLTGNSTAAYHEVTIIAFFEATREVLVRVLNAGGSSGSSLIRLWDEEISSIKEEETISNDALSFTTRRWVWGQHLEGSIESDDEDWSLNIEPYLSVRWSSDDSFLNEGRATHGCEFDGTHVYAIGGIDDDDTLLSSVEQYDSSAETWTIVSDMNDVRSEFPSAWDGTYIYALGGRTLDGSEQPTDLCERYDPSADSWSSITSMPGPLQMNSAALVEDSIYVFGGFDDNTLSSPVDTVYEYDISADSWSTVASMPVSSARRGAATDGTYIYAIGGDDGSSEMTATHRYDPSADSWTSLDDLLVGLMDAGAAYLRGDVYAFGGEDEGGDVMERTYRYDIEDNIWNEVATMTLERAAPGVATDGENYIHATGGEAGLGTRTSSSERYGPIDNLLPSAPTNLDATLQ